MARYGYCMHNYPWGDSCPHCKRSEEKIAAEIENRKNEVLAIVMNELRNETVWGKSLARRVKELQGDGGPRTCNHAFDEVPYRDATTGFLWKQCRICGVRIQT